MNKKEAMAVEEARTIQNNKLFSYEYVKILLEIIDKQEKFIEKIKEIIFRPSTYPEQDYAEIMHMFLEEIENEINNTR